MCFIESLVLVAVSTRQPVYPYNMAAEESEESKKPPRIKSIPVVSQVVEKTTTDRLLSLYWLSCHVTACQRKHDIFYPVLLVLQLKTLWHVRFGFWTIYTEEDYLA